MNSKNKEEQNNTFNRILEIKKRIYKPYAQQPLFSYHPMHMYDIYLNFNLMQAPICFQQTLKYSNKRKIKKWIDDIPILVGVDELNHLETCTICLLDLDQKNVIKILNCNHFFHQECINKWLELKAECPTCRDNVLK